MVPLPSESKTPAPTRWNRPKLFALVATGGAIGSLLRYGVFQLFPTHYSFVGTMSVNIIGSFVLGYLVSAIATSIHNASKAQQIRALVGTGICGGFTTYSTFMLDLPFLFLMGAFSLPWFVIATGYLFGTFILGAGAAILGMHLGAR